MKLIVTPAGNVARINEYVSVAKRNTDAEYAFQLSRDRSVTPLKIAESAGFRRDWTRRDMEVQTRGVPAFDLMYDDLEPHDGWLWKIVNPNYPSLFVVERDGPAMRDLIVTGKKVSGNPKLKSSFYRFPHFPRDGGLSDRYRASVERVWDAVEPVLDYITVNQYLRRDDTRTNSEKLADMVEMGRFARELAGPDRPVYFMVWHSWAATDLAIEHYATVALAAKHSGADGLWCWADVQGDGQLAVELAKLLAFLPHWHKIIGREKFFHRVQSPTLRARAMSGWASLNARSWQKKTEAAAHGEAA